MYCWNCGKENRHGALYCRYCGKKLTTAFETKDIANDELSVLKKQTSSRDNVDHETDQCSRISRGVKRCPKCGGAMFVHETTERRSFWKIDFVLFYIVPVIGWLLLFLIYLNVRDKVTSTLVCEQCGYTENC